MSKIAGSVISPDYSKGIIGIHDNSYKDGRCDADVIKQSKNNRCPYTAFYIDDEGYAVCTFHHLHDINKHHLSNEG